MKILVTNAWRYTEEEKEELSRAGAQIIDMDKESGPLPCPADEIDAIVCANVFRYHPIEEFTSLRYVQISSTGFNNHPVDYMDSHGIEFRNAKGVFAVPISESVLAAVLSFLRDMRFYEANKKAHVYKRKGDSLELCGKTVCMIGCGDIGKACAKRFRAFECRVLGANRTVREDPLFDRIYPLSEIPSADIYVLSIALNNETKGLLKKDFFTSLPDGAIFCNVGRGAVIDEASLIGELKNGRISAYLDVYENEPLPPSSPLWDLPNVIMTPHSTSDGDNIPMRLDKCIMDNLREYLS